MRMYKWVVVSINSYTQNYAFLKATNSVLKPTKTIFFAISWN